MARTGLYKSEVKKARETLLAQGRHPSVDAIRVELGNTGSKTTIHKYLKELEIEYGGADHRKASISDALNDLVARLAVQLENEANVRLIEIQGQHSEKERQLANNVASLNVDKNAIGERLQQAETVLRDEALTHAQTKESLQRETITRHILEQQVSDLNVRLAENEAHRLSLEEKHQHAREALEHYRESVKEQRDQDCRRHEQQVQQLQAEMRQLQQSFVLKQNEVTHLNLDGARLVAELSQAQKTLYDTQEQVRHLTNAMEVLRAAAGRIPVIESELANKEEQTHDLKSQLGEMSAQNNELKAQAQLQQLELTTSRASLETQKMIMAELQLHFVIKKEG
jgi:DNA repair exonuclease SbcCD ATPase subunit